MAFGNATKGYVKKHSGGGGGGGTSNYNDLSNKPSINGVTLSGNKTSEELGITGGGSNMVVYDENYATSSSEEIYDLSSKLSELGFTGGDVALITCMPTFETSESKGIALTLYDTNYYNTLASTRNYNYAKGLCAILTTNIPYYNTAKLRFYFESSTNNHVKISIRIIKAPTNNN